MGNEDSDAFQKAVNRINYAQEHNGAERIFFWASREKTRNGKRITIYHNGADFFVDNPNGSKSSIGVPSEKAVFIGRCTQEMNASLGNALVFFLPENKEKNYPAHFMIMAHLGSKNLLPKKYIGREFSNEPGKDITIAQTRGIAKGRDNHIHVSVTNEFYGFGRNESWTVDFFMQKYKDGTLTEFLKGRNFFAIVPKKRQDRSAYENPIVLVESGQLKFSARKLTHKNKLQPIPIVKMNLPGYLQDREHAHAKPNILAMR